LITFLIGVGIHCSQPSLAATSSTLFSSPASISSWYCLEVLNCEAVGGLPPAMRFNAAARALSPPAMALSTHWPPALL
jgi:hypothetical protein